MTHGAHTGAQALDGGRVCLLVTGVPGAGKTTVANRLAGSLPRSALLSGDMIARLVVGGYVWPLGEPAEEAASQVALCNTNLCALAEKFMDAGFTPVIDWVVPDGAQLDVFRRALGSRLRLLVLDPSAATCVARDLGRPPQEQFAFDGHEQLRMAMWDGFGSSGWWLDTTDLTVAATTEHVLLHADARAPS